MKKIIAILACSFVLFAASGQIIPGDYTLSDIEIQQYTDVNIKPNALNQITALKMNFIISLLNGSKLNIDSVQTIRISGDSLFVDQIDGSTDTLVAGGTSYWTATGNDIENNNTGKVTFNGDSAYFYPLPDEAIKVGRIPTLLTNGEMQYTHPIGLYEAAQDSMAKMSTPSEYGTWVRDATNKQLRIIDETDKIKEIRTFERENTPLITFQFDDARDDVYNMAFPLFEEFGKVACLPVITDSIGTPGYMTWAQINEVAAAGWEIMNHSADSSHLYDMTVAQAEALVTKAKDSLNARGYAANNFVFPQNKVHDSLMVMIRKYHRSARAWNYDTINVGILNTYCLTGYNCDGVTDSVNHQRLIDSTFSICGWMLMYQHDIDAADLIGLRSRLKLCDELGLQVVTVDQALDIIGNQIDLSDNFSVQNNEMVVGDRWYVRYNNLSTLTYNKYKVPLFHRTVDTTTAGQNLFFGTLSGNFNISAAGGAATLASWNQAFGDFSLTSITKGYNNSAFGYGALRHLTEGYDNVAVGARAGDSLTTGYRNVLIGKDAGRNITTQIDNINIGYKAGDQVIAEGNVYIGTNAGLGVEGSTTSAANYNTGIGMSTLSIVSSGNNNTAVGYQSLVKITSGEKSTAFGSNAAYYPTGGYNTMLGAYAGYGISGSSTSYTVSIGYQSMYGNNGALRSVAVGSLSGYTITTGDDNVYLGMASGYTNSTGSRNTFLGYRSGYLETGSNRFYFASDSTQWANGMASASKLLIYADQSNADKANHFMNIFAKVAIGEAKAISAYSLEVAGSANITGLIRSGTGTVADNDATPDVSGYNIFIYAGSANAVNVSDIDNPVVGAIYTFIGNSDTYTMTIGGANWHLAGSSPSLGEDDVLTIYVKADNDYIEISRSNNTP